MNPETPCLLRLATNEADTAIMLSPITSKQDTPQRAVITTGSANATIKRYKDQQTRRSLVLVPLAIAGIGALYSASALNSPFPIAVALILGGLMAWLLFNYVLPTPEVQFAQLLKDPSVLGPCPLPIASRLTRDQRDALARAHRNDVYAEALDLFIEYHKEQAQRAAEAERQQKRALAAGIIDSTAAHL